MQRKERKGKEESGPGRSGPKRLVNSPAGKPKLVAVAFFLLPFLSFCFAPNTRRQTPNTVDEEEAGERMILAVLFANSDGNILIERYFPTSPSSHSAEISSRSRPP